MYAMHVNVIYFFHQSKRSVTSWRAGEGPPHSFQAALLVLGV